MQLLTIHANDSRRRNHMTPYRREEEHAVNVKSADSAGHSSAISTLHPMSLEMIARNPYVQPRIIANHFANLREYNDSRDQEPSTVLQVFRVI